MERTAGRRDSELVRQTAELLSRGGSLSDLFERFCLLLAQFVDASVVFIALESEHGIHIEFVYDHGLSARGVHAPVRPESQSFRVMHTGESLLMREPHDLPAYPVPLQIPGAGDEDAASAIFVPLRFGARPIGVLSVQSAKSRAYDEYDLQLLETCALYVAVALQAQYASAHDGSASLDGAIDAVTGVPTRRMLDDRLSREWARARRTGSPLSIILMDVDRFRAFNDTYGHIAGDSCLAQVAHAARSCVARSSDVFARYGGDAFAAVLCDVPAKAAAEIAERMRKAVGALQIPHAGNPDGFASASFGVACSSALSDDPRPLLRRVERALLAAKTGGRDRVALDAPAQLDESPHYSGTLPPLHGGTIGRRIELDALARSLALSRLTTVVGPAGCGKTHCALAVAHQLMQAYVHGAWFFDVSLSRDAEDLDAMLCGAIDARLAAHRNPRDAVVNFFTHKHCLIVIDRCEHVASHVAEFCTALLGRAHRATVLATSSEPLNVPHERAFHLSALTRDDAEALFCANAVASDVFDARDRAHVRNICKALGDLPMAIMMAAPRVSQFAPLELSAMLNAPHTLDDIVAWSYARLDERARRLLERLSIFASDFDADAARDVCGFAPLRPGEAAAAFDELIEQRLVTRALFADEQRFIVAQAVRAFAARRLRERGEEAVMSERHAQYFLECAQRLSDRAGLREWAEFRAALERSFANGSQCGAAFSLVLALCPWLVRTHRVREARTWIDRALALADPADPRKVDLLAAAVTAAEADADYASLREHASEMLALAKSARQRAQLGRVCDALGNAEKHLGNGKAAVQWYTSALAHYRACGDEHGRALVLLDLGAAAADIDLDFTRAHAYFLEALEIFQQLGSTPDVGVALAKAGAVAGQMGDYDSAIAYSSQSLSVFERVANPCAQAWQLVSIAHYRIERQEWERAAAALRSAHGILQEHPHREYSAMLLEVGLYLAGDLKRDELTARIAGYLHAYRERERVPRLASAQRHYDGRVQRARRRLGTHAFEAAFASGAQAAPDALVAEVIRA